MFNKMFIFKQIGKYLFSTYTWTRIHRKKFYNQLKLETEFKSQHFFFYDHILMLKVSFCGNYSCRQEQSNGKENFVFNCFCIHL